jgi:hypothetical protein
MANTSIYGTTAQDAADAATYGTGPTPFVDRPNPNTATFDGPGTIPAMGFPAIPQWLMIAAAAAAVWYFMRKK